MRRSYDARRLLCHKGNNDRREPGRYSAMIHQRLGLWARASSPSPVHENTPALDSKKVFLPQLSVVGRILVISFIALLGLT